MKKLLFTLIFGFVTVSNAMDHATQVDTYVMTQQWKPLIQYMVHNNLSADLLLKWEPTRLDAGLGKHRFLVKLIAYIRSKDTPEGSTKAARAILKSLLVANKFDLKNKDGFEGDLGKQRYLVVLNLAIEAKEQQIAAAHNLHLTMAIGAAVIITAGLYAWYKRTTKIQNVAADQEENNLDEHNEGSKQENQEIVTVQ